MEYMQEDLEMGSHTQQVSAAQHNRRVIESLDVDCWRLILGRLTVRQLVKTERTCKDWQTMVLDHLAFRPIVVTESHTEQPRNALYLYNSTDTLASFKLWVKKCGNCVQDFIMDWRCPEDVVEALRGNCPNLIAIEVRKLKKELSPTNTQHFPKLKKLNLYSCDVTDDCVSPLMTNELEVLVIMYNKRLTGRFLYNLKSDNMKYLALEHCRAFKFPYLFFVADRFTNLRSLKLWKRNRSKIEIRNKLHLLLDKMPNLVELSIVVHDMVARYDNSRRLAESNVFYESVSRLKKMRLLTANFEVWDHHLEAIAGSCTKLMFVDLKCTHITRRGLDALCGQVGIQLSQLNLSYSKLTDDDIVACVYACPNLLMLLLADCPMLDEAVPLIAYARRAMRAHAAYGMAFVSRLPLFVYMRQWDFYGDPDDLEDAVHVNFTDKDNFVDIEE